VVAEAPALNHGVRVYGIPFTQIALDLGKGMVKNIVALGALQAATDLFPPETFLTAVREALRDKCAMIPLNEEAFRWGVTSFLDEYGSPQRA
jgi:2-oxoisovalerate ferredoxin oxidoreductase beta subunit